MTHPNEFIHVIILHPVEYRLQSSGNCHPCYRQQEDAVDLILESDLGSEMSCVYSDKKCLVLTVRMDTKR